MIWTALIGLGTFMLGGLIASLLVGACAASSRVWEVRDAFNLGTKLGREDASCVVDETATSITGAKAV